MINKGSLVVRADEVEVHKGVGLAAGYGHGGLRLDHGRGAGEGLEFVVIQRGDVGSTSGSWVES